MTREEIMRENDWDAEEYATYLDRLYYEAQCNRMWFEPELVCEVVLHTRGDRR